MKERPILFSAPMVRAILAGKKTQTRRIVDPKRSGFQEPIRAWCANAARAGEAATEPSQGRVWMALGGDTGNRQQAPWRPCPYGQPGDLLWVRETWNALYPVAGDDIPWYHHELSPEQRIQPATPIYRASEDGPNYPTSDDIEAGFKWQPSIFMPRWASRILLRVVSVRVERLQDITEADAQAEGMPKEFEVDAATFVQGQPLPESTHYLGFKHLWREINGAESWDANPWVWVVEFEVVK